MTGFPSAVPARVEVDGWPSTMGSRPWWAESRGKGDRDMFGEKWPGAIEDDRVLPKNVDFARVSQMVKVYR